jgi:hypothetical protein
MIRVVKNRNYKEALKQMKISRWYTQVPNKADELIEYNGGLLWKPRDGRLDDQMGIEEILVMSLLHLKEDSEETAGFLTGEI